MNTAKKHPRPASDRSPNAPISAIRKNGRVKVSRSFSGLKKTAAGLVLGVALGAALTAAVAGNKDAVNTVVMEGQIEPYDIVINAPDPQPAKKQAPKKAISESKKKVSSPVKAKAVQTKPAKAKAAQAKPKLKPKPKPQQASTVRVIVEADPNADIIIQAEDEAATAQWYLRQNDIEEAIQTQRRAVQILPSHMGYKLKLAIMLDRDAQAAEAAALYRDVLAAAEKGDKTLPANLDIAEIRHRAEYLGVMARK